MSADARDAAATDAAVVHGDALADGTTRLDAAPGDAATDAMVQPCGSGFTSDGAGGCRDIDECASANGGCGTARCANTPGGFNCFDAPVSLVLAGEVSTATVGPGGSPHSWLCPPGQLIIGINSSYIDGYGASGVWATCGVPSLVRGAAGGYSITVAPAPDASPAQNPCPANEIVVGVAINSATYIRSVTASCAPLTVAFSASDGYAVTVGTPHALPTYPPSAPAPNGSASCPTGAVANGMLVSGGQLVGAVGLQCTEVRLHLNVPDITFGPTSDTPVVGVRGQTAQYVDVCPTGQMVTGIKLYDQMRAIAVQCGTPSIDTPPRVVVSSGALLPFHGDREPGSIFACPGQALVGFSGYEGGWGIFQLALRCAPLQSARTPSGFDIAVGASAQYGNPSATNFMTECPAGTVGVGVASRLVVQSNGYSALTGLGVRCARPGTM